MIARVSIVKNDRTCLVLLQPQLLAQLRIRLLVASPLDFSEKGVFKEALLDGLYLLGGSLFRVLREDRSYHSI